MELEAVDFNRGNIVLPEGCSWALKEVTLVNSNGIAVDSRKHSKNLFGGEINTPPTFTIKEQLKIAEDCLKALKKDGATVNYRCNTQTHVGGWDDPNSEKETLKRLKAVQQYAFNNYKPLLLLTMGKGQWEKKDHYPTSFWSHYKERMVPAWKHKYLMEAKTLNEFRKAMFFSKAGTHAPLCFMRQGINTHSFFKTQTIEFRIFWGTLDIEHIKKMLQFSKAFMDDALGSQDAFNYLVEYFRNSFPPENEFNQELETGFIQTRVAKPS